MKDQVLVLAISHLFSRCKFLMDDNGVDMDLLRDLQWVTLSDFK